ncbi:MAG: serine acetyltransferase [Acutalibacteraceae bacterium]
MKIILAYIRFIPIMLFSFLYKNNERLQMDSRRWGGNKEVSYNKRYAILMADYREFRNVFIYRNINHPIFKRWVAFWYPPEKTLFIECPDIGGGLFVQHGFATYISAEKIGKNFSVNQQVTIGFNGSSRCPRIGDNVMVTCGAKVLGDIEIGDNTRIGANAVVLKDYKRGHGILVGIPAVPKKEASKELLKSLGIEIDESLFD